MTVDLTTLKKTILSEILRNGQKSRKNSWLVGLRGHRVTDGFIVVLKNYIGVGIILIQYL